MTRSIRNCRICAEVAPALAGAAPPKTTGNEVGDFFSGMNYQDLQKKAPAQPPRPGTGTR